MESNQKSIRYISYRLGLSQAPFSLKQLMRVAMKESDNGSMKTVLDAMTTGRVRYNLTLNSFTQKVKRSAKHQSDTIVVQLSRLAYTPNTTSVVGANVVQKVTLGDFGDAGTYPIGMSMDLEVASDGSETAMLGFELSNGESSIQVGNIIDWAITFYLAALPPPYDLTGAIWRAVSPFTRILPNCDGTVAADIISIDPSSDNITYPRIETREYPGLKSPSGCGENSLYDVDYTVDRTFKI